MTPPRDERLVGRDDALRSLERMLDELDRGRPAVIELAGEAGIGKTRLLRELAMRAELRGHLVLAGAAAELERDLPFSVFVDALDQHVAGLDPNLLAALDDQVRTELAHVFPSLWALAGSHTIAAQHERYRSHRAVRSLLELLAGTRPLVLMLDDLQWIDPASVELLGSLLRRPPRGRVGMALALRPLRSTERLQAAVERSHRSGALVRIDLAPLTPLEARQLLGQTVGAPEAATLYEESGGNPFYLEQLARSLDRAGIGDRASRLQSTDIGVPAAVAASLTEELGLLSEDARLVFEGAAVAGDPFEPELAAAAAETSEASAMDAIDELLRVDLVRTTDGPLRIPFPPSACPPRGVRGHGACLAGGCSPAVRRCARLAGGSCVMRAHHVERSARQGDLVAVAILREAGQAAARLAPESAARWFGGALRLLPPTAQMEERVELLFAGAEAWAAAGQFTQSHDALEEAIAIVPEPGEPPGHPGRDHVRWDGAPPGPLRTGQRSARQGPWRPHGGGLGLVDSAADRAHAKRVLPLEIRGDAPLGRACSTDGPRSGRSAVDGGSGGHASARRCHDRAD